MRPTLSRGLPAPLEAERFLIRARQYRAQAILLADMEGAEPNWPKYFLITHAIELAITAFLVFAKAMGQSRTGKKADNHDLMAL
jgi:hypothetical protein